MTDTVHEKRYMFVIFRPVILRMNETSSVRYNVVRTCVLATIVAVGKRNMCIVSVFIALSSKPCEFAILSCDVPRSAVFFHI